MIRALLIAFATLTLCACGPDFDPSALGSIDLSAYVAHPTPDALADGGSELEPAQAPTPTCQKQCPRDAGDLDGGQP